ncbi:MAG TPA: ABC transporter ATP-binding protein [Gammaproteobacteria bacterium]|nr:ABC transporter ATP-binding protein [Gammaproteobacteria bacterium]
MNALVISSLTKSFSGMRVISDLSLTVVAGERRLIIGPNGAGKTTLFNLITGELEPDAGRLQMLGRDITRVPARTRTHLGLARTYQIITLFPANSLRENVALALLGLSPARWDPFSRLDRNEDIMRGAEAVLARVGLEQLADRPVRQTAYGEQRRVEIAMALAQNPRLLLLDEPFAGLSTLERSDVKALIAAIPHDVTIVMIEHDMDVALDLAEQITVLHFGQVVVEGERAAVVADRRTREIYLGS